jgi:uncharacterized membrane protein
MCQAIGIMATHAQASLKSHFICYAAHIMKRNFSLDLARTFAIVLMVIFHFIYDLKFFGWVNWDIPDGEGWKQFRWIIITLFFLCLGLSLTLAHKRGFRAKKFVTRVAQISGGAFIISLTSYFAIPENWIFFGVLHFLALASLICIFFINMPKLSFLIGIGFIVLGISELVHPRWPFYLLVEGLPNYTNDYVALVPWLGMVFFGISLAHTQWFQKDPLSTYNRLASNQVLIWPGQHSLSIYLLHQPIIMGTMFIIKTVL